MPTSHPSLSTARPDLPARAPDRLAVGDKVGRRSLQTLAGPRPFPDADGLTHLQLRRFAGCPVCNLHLRAFVLRSDEIAAAGIHEVIVFHSSAADLQRYQPDLPFPIVPDPDRELYRAFGAERSRSAVLSPRLWRHVPRILLGVIRRVWQEHQAPRLFPHGGQLGLPADVLLDADGRVSAIGDGEHAYDQWTVDELLAYTRAAGPPAAGERGGEPPDTTLQPPVPATQTSQEHR
jgi:AhpC/TSA antioxidant enzyme